MRDFQSTMSVEPVGDAFAVVRVEQWRHDRPPAVAKIVRNRIMADGPFHTRADAAAALARIDARAIERSYRPGAAAGASLHPDVAVASAS